MMKSRGERIRIKDLKDKQKEAAAKPPVKDAAEKQQNQRQRSIIKIGLCQPVVIATGLALFDGKEW